jgi:release factor glutamine methyltransferase
MNFLQPGGRFYLETHPEWANFIQEMAKNLGYSNASIRKDLSKKDRFLLLEL